VGDALGSSLFSRREAALQGVPAFEPQAQASIDLDSFVAADHFLCRIDRVLDLAFVRELTAPRYAAEKGRPSIDPEVYFRMQLVAYFYGIAKDRRLCEEVHYNLAYRWFCRLSFDDDVPDHSSLTRIRGRLGEAVFEAVFRRIVAQCQQKGLVKDPCRVMTDATLIAADASLDSLVHNDPEQAQIEADSQRRRRGLLDPSANRRVTNRTHRSRTDPEATLAQKRGTAQQLKYKVHQTIDADSRVILDTEVTTEERDTTTSRILRSWRACALAARSRFVKRSPIAATVRLKLFARSRVNRRPPSFPCGAVAWGTANI
jgi:transposase